MADAVSCIGVTPAWGRMKNLSGGCAYESYPGIDGTGQTHFFIAIPESSGAFGLIAGLEGDGDYHHSLLGIAYAREVAKGIRIGLRIDHVRAFFRGYGHSGALPVEISAQWQAGPPLAMTLSVYDPFRVSLSVRYPIPMHRLVRAGLGYSFGPSLAMAAEWQSSDGLPPSLSVLLFSHYLDKVQAHIGISTGQDKFILALGFRKYGLLLNLFASCHAALGWSSGLSLQWGVFEHVGS